MKKQNLKILNPQHVSRIIIILFVFTTFQACENSNEATVNNSKQGEQVSFSGCKENNLKSTFSESKKPSITIQTVNSTFLSVTHKNAIFNCVFDNLIIDYSIEDNVIVIYEKQVNPNAFCTCTYDIEYQIGPLTYDETYSIKIIDESLNNDEISFDFEFTSNTSMTFYED